MKLSGRRSAPFDGLDVALSRELRWLRRRMQIIYQDPYESLDPRFRVDATVEEPLIVHRLGAREERHERVVRALEQAGLSPAELYLGRYPHELSGGQRQRVAIAASLALGPELLVATSPSDARRLVRAGILATLDELRDSGPAVLMMRTTSRRRRFATGSRHVPGLIGGGQRR